LLSHEPNQFQRIKNSKKSFFAPNEKLNTCKDMTMRIVKITFKERQSR
jgi:hypothetical protein